MTPSASFQEFLQACNALGYEQCPLDIVSFHPFNTDVSVYTEMTNFAQSSAKEFLVSAHWKQNPVKFAFTAWAEQGSGMFITNENVDGAHILADILINMQNLPIEFSIYYKFDGWNVNNDEGPSLVLLDGQLKPTAYAFVLMSKLLSSSTQRKVSSCSNGDSIVAVYNPSKKTVTAVLAGQGTSPVGTFHVSGTEWPCTEKASTLSIETVVQKTDGSGSTSVSTVQGSVHGSGLFYKHGDASSPYVLGGSSALGKSAYVAKITLSCGA